MFIISEQEIVEFLNKTSKIPLLPAYYSHNDLFETEKSILTEYNDNKNKQILTELMNIYDTQFNKAKLMSYQLARFPEYSEVMQYIES